MLVDASRIEHRGVLKINHTMNIKKKRNDRGELGGKGSRTWTGCRKEPRRKPFIRGGTDEGEKPLNVEAVGAAGGQIRKRRALSNVPLLRSETFHAGNSKKTTKNLRKTEKNQKVPLGKLGCISKCSTMRTEKSASTDRELTDAPEENGQASRKRPGKGGISSHGKGELTYALK